MLVSMTGFGSGSANADGINVSVEVRSVNNRFCEVAAKLPRSLQTRELEIKDIVRTKASRGKINVAISIEREGTETVPVKVDIEAAHAYAEMFNQLRNALGLKAELSLDTLLNFSNVLTVPEETEESGAEWTLVQKALEEALGGLQQMRQNEGRVITEDLKARVEILAKHLSDVERLATEKIPLERDRLKERVAEIIGDAQVDPMRLELEIVLLADKLDTTEECVRFKSHVQFFLEALLEKESSGRKLNFLLQEMNREANTIGAKCNDATIAHIVVGIKDELERIREQIQNIE